MAVMALMLMNGLLVIRSFSEARPVASILLMPALVWLVFYWILNFTQWRLNGGGMESLF
jgi:tryptophan-rich sensory protein